MNTIPLLFVKAMADVGMTIGTAKYPQHGKWINIDGCKTKLADVVLHDINVVEYGGNTLFSYRIPEDRGKGNVHATVTFVYDGTISVYTMRPIPGPERSVRKTQVFDHKDPSFTGFDEIIAIVKKAIEPLPCSH